MTVTPRGVVEPRAGEFLTLGTSVPEAKAMASSVFEHATGNAPGHGGVWRPRLRWKATPLDRLKTHAVEFARLRVLGTKTVRAAFSSDWRGDARACRQIDRKSIGA